MKKDNFYYKVKGEYKISHGKLINFLASNGFAKVIEDKEVKLVYVRNKIIKEVMDVNISDYIVNFLRRKGLREVLNVFSRSVGHYLSKKLLQTLPTLDLLYPKDKIDTAYFYYKNAVVCVNKDKIDTIEFHDLKKPIWEGLIIDYPINIVDYKSSQFESFMYNISNKQEGRFESLKSIIGYLLHNYQDPSFARSVILVDEKISNDGSANGGTGKSLINQAISKLRNVLTVDGKNLKNESRFFFQQVNKTTNVICYDDVRRDFDFETLYSSITSGINVEKKYKAEISIPFKDSPKILISSNYAVIGTGGNTDSRRRIEFEVANYYTKDFTPIKEFENRFFDEWDTEEWNNFYLFMIDCVQFYLNNGVIFPKPINLKENKLEQITCSEFIEYMDANLEVNTRLDKRDFYKEFLKFSNRVEFSQHIFTKWLRVFALYNDLEYSDKSSNGSYYFKFSTKK
ncbi:hypothetical protein FF125_17395 [Aureibaculum algae]|uniref:NrS-1 polymerase-like helicase domain-containing protein n=1 Tax=Aureibaculum algae TaxID=2584122 RepID=A0A5B7TXM9_9FLAO|nr:DUF5906 domain-containing protein [Aureibaculum algae]QCX40133.1 hypothetical protein FF125_17395 [Aureibaculum algae]